MIVLKWVHMATRFTLATCCVFVIGICPGMAAADLSSTVDFNIVPQQLPSALLKYSEQSGVLVTSPTELVQGKATPGVVGAFPARQALDRLLEGTALGYEVIGTNTITIFALPAKRTAALAAAAERQGGQPQSFWDRFRLAQVDSGSSAARSVSADEGARDKVDEVIVTATKRPERARDVPVSLAVIGNEEIARRGLVSAEDYLRGVPGVNQTTERSGASIIIRGIETSPSAQNFSSGTTVATYFGETPTTNTGGVGGGTNVDIKLVDIDRVEILRGPQGTSFGNSSLGGAVRAIPLEPRLNELEARVAVNYAQTSGADSGNSMAQGVINIPVVNDRLAVRAIGYQFREGGTYRNVASTDPVIQEAAALYGAESYARSADDVGADQYTGGRLAAVLQATENLRFSATYLTQKTEMDGQGVANRPGYQQAMFAVAPEHVIRGQHGAVSDTDINIASITSEYSFGFAKLHATYSDVRSESLWTNPFSLSFVVPGSSSVDSDHREHSGDIRLVTTLAGAWNFIAGVYAEELTDEYVENALWHGDPATNLFGPGVRLLSDYRDHRKLEQTAAYGEVSWTFLPGLTLTGGARAYDYDRKGLLRTEGVFFGSTATPSAAKASGTSFRGSLSYKPNDWSLLYGTWSQGFRLGKPQAGLPPGVCDLDQDGLIDGTRIAIDSTKSVDSDTVDNYELGAKLSLLNERLSLAADVYRIDWTGVPVRVSATCSTGDLAYNANAGSARSEGIEIQASLRATSAVRIDAGASWTHATLTRDAPGLQPPAFEGDRLPGSPRLNANLALQYEFDLLGRNAFIRADSIYVGTFYGDIQQSPLTEAGGYLKLDATAQVLFGQVKLDLFVRNLTNRKTFAFRGTYPTLGDDFGYRLRPRTVGLQVGYEF